jgi:hypothetical protein
MQFCFTSQLACLDLSRESALLLFDNSIGAAVGNVQALCLQRITRLFR